MTDFFFSFLTKMLKLSQKKEVFRDDVRTKFPGENQFHKNVSEVLGRASGEEGWGSQQQWVPVLFWKSSAGRGRGMLCCSDLCMPWLHISCSSCTLPTPPTAPDTVGFQPDRNLSRRTGCELLPCPAALARGLQELKVAFGAIHQGVLAAEH